MSSFSCKEKKSRSSPSNGNKCGEVTFCFQVGKRVYALNCLFCPQICLHWDSFITHMEEEHDDLCSDHLMQKEPREANVNMASERSILDTGKAAEPKNNDPAAGTNSDTLVTPDGCSFTAYSSIKSESIDIMDQYESPGGSGERQDQTCSGYEDELSTIMEGNNTNFNNMFQNTQNLTTLQTVVNTSGLQNLNGKQVPPVTFEGMIENITKVFEPMFITLTNEVISLRQEIIELRKEVKVLKKEKSASFVMPVNPFTDMDQFLNFEKQLQEDKNFLNSFDKELLSVSKTPNFTRNCWRKLLVDELAKNLCWKGTEEKKSVRSLSVAKAIRNAAVSIGFEEDDYIRSTKSFFQFAKTRQEGKEKYVLKSKKNNI